MRHRNCKRNVVLAFVGALVVATGTAPVDAEAAPMNRITVTCHDNGTRAEAEVTGPIIRFAGDYGVLWSVYNGMLSNRAEDITITGMSGELPTSMRATLPSGKVVTKTFYCKRS